MSDTTVSSITTVNRRELLAELQFVGRAIERKTTIPILSNVLIHSTPNLIKLVGTDLEHAHYSEVEVENGADFNITVPAKQFIDYLKASKSENVALGADETQWLTLLMGAGVSRIAGMSPQSFPEVPWPMANFPAFLEPTTLDEALGRCAAELNANYVRDETDSDEQAMQKATELLRRDHDRRQIGCRYATFEITGLPKAIERTIVAISNEASRFTLNGGLFDNKGKQSVLVTTDGHRLHLASLSASRPPKADWLEGTKADEITQSKLGRPVTHLLIPRKAMFEIERTFDDQYIVVSVNHDHMHFRQPHNPRQILSRKLSGIFPDYERVIPKADDLSSVQVKPSQFIDLINQVKPYADKRSHAVRVTIDHAVLTVFASTSERGEGKASLPLPTNGVKLESGFNADYLLEALEPYKKADSIAFHFKDANHAAQFSAVDGYKSIVMPMRI